MKTYLITTSKMQENIYIFVKGNQAIIVDPGDDYEKIVELIENQKLELKYILLTHGHGDHIGAVNKLKEKYDLKVYAHKDEKNLLEDTSLNVSNMLGNPVTVKADVLIDEESIIDFEGLDIRVIHTPGHTQGGVCYYFDNKLVSGDTLFKGSVGRSDLPTGNQDLLIKSINEKLMNLPDETQVLPGHGDITTIGYERENNPYIIS